MTTDTEQSNLELRTQLAVERCARIAGSIVRFIFPNGLGFNTPYGAIADDDERFGDHDTEIERAPHE